jgi:predicted house-cleaning NTP pyrophosphatase (Maf/HAM1 superfamily)
MQPSKILNNWRLLLIRVSGGESGVVARIEGCFSNVIGLSLPLLRRWLAEA